MSTLNLPDHERRYQQNSAQRYESYNSPARWTNSGGVSTGWLLAGAGAIALGAFAAYYFGPDFRRYIKMERM